MSTFTAIIEPSPDGTLHLPLPAEWRHLPIRVKAELEPVAAEVIAGKELKKNAPARNGKGHAVPGLWKDLPGPCWMAADFNEPLEDFREYME